MRMFEKQSKRVYSPRCMFIGRKKIYAVMVCCAASLFSSAAAGTNGLEQIFSRQFGGSDGDFPTVLTVDANGCTYIAGYTYSTNFPATPGRNGPGSDLFVTKLSATGELIYSRVLGGSGYEVPAAIAADHLGNVYVTGGTTSTNFPLVRITNLKTSHVFYSRTHDHSSMAVASGSLVSTHFDVPATQETGPSLLEVVANGVASFPVPVVVH